MSEKLAVVRRWVELYNERTDATEFLSLLDPEVELQRFRDGKIVRWQPFDTYDAALKAAGASRAAGGG